MSAVERPLRLGVYTDYPYHRLAEQVYSERAFSVFVSRLAEQPAVESLTVIGRLDPTPARARYPLGAGTRFVPLPFYPKLSEPLPAIRAIAGSLRAFWSALTGIEAVWLLGPHPLSFLFAFLAAARGRRVVLGVRQDSVEYIRNRHPGRRLAQAAARVARRRSTGCWRASATSSRSVPGSPPSTGDSRACWRSPYRWSRRGRSSTPRWLPRGTTRVRSACSRSGASIPEKNPLMLADVLAALRREDPRWSLVVCGEGSMEPALAERIAALGLGESAELRGYVALDGGLRDLYRECHVLLHVSWTEGLPQVLFEAFAAGLPVVATDVGGIAAAVGPAVSLIPAGEAGAAATAVARVASDPELRSAMIREGNRIARMRTIQSETSRVARFLAGG